MNNGWECENLLHKQDFSLTGEFCDDAYFDITAKQNELNEKYKNAPYIVNAEMGEIKRKYTGQVMNIAGCIKIVQEAMRITGKSPKEIDGVLETFTDSFTKNLDLQKIGEIFSIDKKQALENLKNEFRPGQNWTEKISSQERKEGMIMDARMYSVHAGNEAFYEHVSDMIEENISERRFSKEKGLSTKNKLLEFIKNFMSKLKGQPEEETLMLPEAEEGREPINYKQQRSEFLDSIKISQEGNKMKKCFTINAMRTCEDFKAYDKLITEGLFCGVEIFYPYNVDEDQQKLYEEELTKLLSRHKDLEVVLHLPHGGINNLVLPNFSRNEEIILRMKSAISFAKSFNARKLTLHLGSSYKDEDSYRKNLIEALIPVLRELCEYAGRMNIMIENMPRGNELGYSPQEILYIIKSTNKDNIKFIYDTGHAHVSDFDDLEYIDVLKDYLYHIHFSDNSGKTDEHKPIGCGTYNFNKLFEKLNDIKYPYLHCLEIIFKDASDLEKYAKTIEEFNYLYS